MHKGRNRPFFRKNCRANGVEITLSIEKHEQKNCQHSEKRCATHSAWVSLRIILSSAGNDKDHSRATPFNDDFQLYHSAVLTYPSTEAVYLRRLRANLQPCSFKMHFWSPQWGTATQAQRVQRFNCQKYDTAGILRFREQSTLSHDLLPFFISSRKLQHATQRKLP